MDRPIRFREPIDHHHLPVTLDDLERMGQIRGARDARQEALDLWVVREPVLEVCLLLLERPRLIRDLVADNHALPRWDRTDRAHVGETGAGRVVLQIPMGGADRLPDTVQVGVAIPRARYLSASRLGAHG